jgi:hypothetical protein
MAKIDVVGVQLMVKSVDLTPRVLKQLPVLEWDSIKPLLDGKGGFKDGCVIGWVHGIVLDRSREWEKWLIVKVSEHVYGRYAAMDSTCKKYPQIIL